MSTKIEACLEELDSANVFATAIQDGVYLPGYFRERAREILSRHFGKAEAELLMVRGQQVVVCQDLQIYNQPSRGHYIANSNRTAYLNCNGEWQDTVLDSEGKLNAFWPTQAAAEAHVRAVAAKETR